MKVFLAVLSIALVAQVSFAASTQHSKRETKNSYEVLKELVAETKSMADAVLKDIPNTEAYSSFKAYWKGFLETYDTKRDDISCFVKTGALWETFGEAINEYRESDATEDKEMLRLFNKYGMEAFAERAESVADNAEDVDITEFEAERC